MARRAWIASSLAICLTISLALVGCGGGPATESVSGKVTANGQPVTGGTLMFAPASDAAVAVNEPTSAVVESDGSYSVPVVAGKNRITYYPPAPAETPSVEWDGKGKPPDLPKGPYDGLKAEPAEVDIKAGGNELTIQLVPR